MSVEVSDTELLLYETSALSPPDSARIRELLAFYPALLERLNALRAEGLSPTADTDPWRVPPPGASWPLWSARRRMMGAGDKEMRLAFGDRPDAEDRWVIVLARQRGRWMVVSPVSETARVQVSSLPLDREGTRVLVLPAMMDPVERWAIALPPWGLDADWDLQDPWFGVRELIATGAIPVAAVAAEE